MRLYVKKLLQVLFAGFLFVVIYLNLNVSNLGFDARTRNSALPWGASYKHGHQHLPFSEKRIHDHVLRSGLTQNSTKSLGLDVSIASPPKTLIYPSAEHYSEDRILNQLHFIPQGVNEASLKKILVMNGLGSWSIPRGQTLFKEQKCEMNSCELFDERSRMQEADVVLFQGLPNERQFQRPTSQIWVLFMLESPYHTSSFSAAPSVFNWTATYRHDSTIVAPYEKYVPFNTSLQTRRPLRNYAEGKTKKVAWFVSNCGARNGRRQYADELAKYIQVDIYGACGTLKCPRFTNDRCFEMLNKDYKFYLAFENSNCRDYITEKFFINGLKHDVIPVVMGAAPEDYERAAPPHSYIHVDDFESPKELAEYLLKLDKDDALYNEYFAWKGLGDIINTFFWCRMCALAHDVPNRGPSWFQDVDRWWRGHGVCIGQDNWRKTARSKTKIADYAITLKERTLATVN